MKTQAKQNKQVNFHNNTKEEYDYVASNEQLGRDKVKKLIGFLDKKNSTSTTLSFTEGEFDRNDGYINGSPFDVKYRYNTVDKYDSQQITIGKFNALVRMAKRDKAKSAVYIVCFQDGYYLIFDLLKIDSSKLRTMSGKWSKVNSEVMHNYLIPNNLGIKIDPICT